MNKENLDLVFHAYDIRGLVKTQLDEDFFYQLGKSFVTYLNAKNIAVGYDIRPESQKFAAKFIEGATELGCNVKLVNEIATEMLYYAVGSDELMDGGATITASHNPAGWNGCKMVGKSARAISDQSGLIEIKNIIRSENFLNPTGIKGNVTEKDIYPEFKTKILSFIGKTTVKPMNIIIDAGNGIGGKIFDYIFGDLGLNVTKMYFEPDGNFPNHVPDPIKEENVKEIMQKVIDQKADLGIAIDGDSDRVFFIDSRGRNPNGVYTGSIFAKHFCELTPGAKIIHDPRITWPIEREVKKVGGIPVVSKAGHSFLKEKMKAEDAVYGAEMSAHFYYKDFYYADSGMVTIAVMLKLLNQGLDFTKEMDYLYSTYIVSGEVNYKVQNPDELIQKAKEKYSSGTISEIDGVSIEFPDWRFNLRRSNTESVLRLNLEGISEAIVKEKFDELEELIGSPRLNEPAIKSLLK